ncbi:MAG: OmpA family protein [Acetobacteraceae bacterium]
MSAAPPPPPSLPGVAPAPSAPPATVAMSTPAAPSSPNAVAVTFVVGSAALTSTATDTLKQLAARRGAGVIAVTGFGDATSSDPDAQSAALALGLSRAQAMAGALTSAGVPASAVQIDASALGRGGTARLVQ